MKRILNLIKVRLNRLIYLVKKRLVDDQYIYLVYSMGKVGSSTIYESLKRKKPYSDVFHVHFLSKNYLETILPRLNEKSNYGLTAGNKMLAFIEKRPKARFKIITLTREPIERAISDLFENWRRSYQNIELESREGLKSHIESLDHSYALGWFDAEFKEYLGFDIYNEKFDKGRGYGIYRHGRYEIMCIKLESLNDVATEAFIEFLGEDIPLIKVNFSEGKTGKESYNYLKNNVDLSVSSLEKLYNSKYIRHFYTQEEIEFFIRKWNKTTSQI